MTVEYDIFTVLVFLLLGKHTRYLRRAKQFIHLDMSMAMVLRSTIFAFEKKIFGQ